MDISGRSIVKKDELIEAIQQYQSKRVVTHRAYALTLAVRWTHSLSVPSKIKRGWRTSWPKQNTMLFGMNWIG